MENEIIDENFKTQKDFIEEITKIRKESGMSQRAASRNGHISQSTISRLEKGELDPGLKFLLKYLNSLNKTLKIIDI